MPNVNKKASLLLQPAQFSDPQSPWRVVTLQREKQCKGSITNELEDTEPKLWCGVCKAPRHNARKQTCRSCGEPRPPQAGGKVVQQKGEGFTTAPQEKPGPCGKQLGRFLLELGTKLRTTDLSAVNSVEKTGSPQTTPQNMEDMSTEALTSATTALATLGFPDVRVKPFRDAIEEGKQQTRSRKTKPRCWTKSTPSNTTRPNAATQSRRTAKP